MTPYDINMAALDAMIWTGGFALAFLIWVLVRERFWAGFTVAWRRLFGHPPIHPAE